MKEMTKRKTTVPARDLRELANPLTDQIFLKKKLQDVNIH